MGFIADLFRACLDNRNLYLSHFFSTLDWVLCLGLRRFGFVLSRNAVLPTYARREANGSYITVYAGGLGVSPAG